MNNTIRVTGKADINTPPDAIQVSIDLVSLELEYEDSLNYSAELLEKIRCVLGAIGFKREDIKTSYFNIDSEYKSYKDKNDKWKREFIGYKVKNSVKIIFEQDSEKLGQVLSAIGKSKIDPDISIRFLLLDDKNLKNKLLEKAVKDSKERASIMAKAAGVRLGQVKHIDYSWGELELYGMDLDYHSDMIIKEESILDIEPEDIKNSETVTVVWGIE